MLITALHAEAVALLMLLPVGCCMQTTGACICSIWATWCQQITMLKVPADVACRGVCSTNLVGIVSMLSLQPCLRARHYSWTILPLRAARYSKNVKGFEEVHILAPWRSRHSWPTLGPRPLLLHNVDCTCRGMRRCTCQLWRQSPLLRVRS